MTSETQGAQSSATPRKSRREIRAAERAAEREAFLTGQQPLLTRREMRRLRQEQEALREAVARGELTEEQARALQNPLADQSEFDLAATPTGAIPTANKETKTPVEEPASTSAPAEKTPAVEETAQEEPAKAAPEKTADLPSGEDHQAAKTPNAAANDMPEETDAAPTATETAEPATDVNVETATETVTDEAEAPVRRPIVRVPHAAQGVRTVDTTTGELTQVSLDEDDFAALAQPRWKAVTVESAASASAPSAVSAATGALNEVEATSGSELAEANDGKESALTANEEPAPDQDESGIVTEAAESAEETRSRKNGILRVLLIGLLCIVIGFVLGTLVWFLMDKGLNSAITTVTELSNYLL